MDPTHTPLPHPPTHTPQDLSRAWQVAERLEYGMVGVNEVAITSEVSCGASGWHACAACAGMRREAESASGSAHLLLDVLRIQKIASMGD